MARFSKDDVHLLYNLLRVPEFYRCPNGTVVGGLESLLLLLRQLIYPNRLSDLCSLFGRLEPELSMIVHKVHCVTYKVPYREMPTSGNGTSSPIKSTSVLPKRLRASNFHLNLTLGKKEEDFKVFRGLPKLNQS